jgi:hypothetical protein
MSLTVDQIEPGALLETKSGLLREVIHLSGAFALVRILCRGRRHHPKTPALGKTELIYVSQLKVRSVRVVA